MRETIIPSPNIWESPDVYEVENRGVDRAHVQQHAFADLDAGVGFTARLVRQALVADGHLGLTSALCARRARAE